jgi:hypothetical protein
MALILSNGQKIATMNRDEDGHREYKIKYQVFSTTGTDLPAAVLQTPGLPLPYSFWLLDSDVDVFAWCKWDAEVVPGPGQVEGEPINLWNVDLTFTTKPPKGYCRTIQVEDPLLEPIKISGSFVKYTEQVSRDRFGLPIVTSSYEQIRGPQVEFDKNRANVKFEYNVPSLNFALVASLVDHLNGQELWGLPPRTIKLSQWDWERQYWGQCSVYYKWTLHFDIRFDTFDRNVLDEGTKVLNGHWGTDGRWKLDNINGQPPNPLNPQHFKRFQDRAGNTSRVILNGAGLPSGVEVGTGSVNPGYGATAVAIMDQTGGTVEFVSVTNPGQGYTAPPTVNFIGEFQSGAGTPASAVAVIQNGKVTDINLISGGSLYLLPPKVTLTTAGAAAGGPPGNINIQYYPEDTDVDPLGFLVLGLPANF